MGHMGSGRVGRRSVVVVALCIRAANPCLGRRLRGGGGRKGLRRGVRQLWHRLAAEAPMPRGERAAGADEAGTSFRRFSARWAAGWLAGAMPVLGAANSQARSMPPIESKNVQDKSQPEPEKPCVALGFGQNEGRERQRRRR